MILRSKKEITKFQIRRKLYQSISKTLFQRDIYIQMGACYRITKNGVEWVLERAIELKKYARFVMEDIVSHVSVATAIARGKFKKGDAVSLMMENGLLYAVTDGDVTGITISDAEGGEDVGVTDLKGMISFPQVNITICKVPRVVSVDEEVPGLLNRLESEGLNYEVVDLSN
jgi:predicted transcriptional regulator